MKNLEYTKMAEYYDTLYQNKNYDKEVSFIENFIDNKDCSILDAGSGTGSHAKILHKRGYNIFGFDLNKEMVKIANQKIKNHFEVGDILTYKSNQRYDMIISFFAVFNHLKNYSELEKALLNMKSLLNQKGKIIIDLHNPQKSGIKKDSINNITRIMKWKVCRLLNKEFSKITYIIENKTYKTNHTFKIFRTCKLIKLCNKLGFSKVLLFEDYSKEKRATNKSKNIQLFLQI